MSGELDRLREALYKRMPIELVKTLETLNIDQQGALLKALHRYHEVMEKELYRLILEFIRVLKDRVGRKEGDINS